MLAALVALGSILGAVIGAALTGIGATAQPRTGVGQSVRIISTTTTARTFPILSIPVISFPLPTRRTVPGTKEVPGNPTTTPVTVTVVVVEVTTTTTPVTAAPTTTMRVTTTRPTTTRPTTTRATTTTRTSTTTSTTSTTSTSSTTSTTTTTPPAVVPAGRSRLTLDSAITRPSRVVMASGAGFTPGRAVRLVRLAAPGVGARALARGRVGVDGTFRVPVLVMPGELPRRWTVQAIDAAGRRARSTLLVVVPPQVPDRRQADRSRAVQR